MRTVLLCIILVAGWSTPVFGQQLKEITNSIGMKLVLIPSGTFTMGTPREEQGSLANETPHEVTISKSYYLCAYEVTQEQYEKVMEKNPSKFKGVKNPIETVSWEDAVAFSKTLSELPEEGAAGREYRLPTEAEWEYACRASSEAAYCFGDSPESLNDYAWYGEGRQSKSHPVGEKKANIWGLYDMHGNVWEWCQDGFLGYPAGAATDPQGPISNTLKVLRGGSYDSGAATCRSAYRDHANPRYRTHNFGFRLAMTPTSKQPEAPSSK